MTQTPLMNIIREMEGKTNIGRGLSMLTLLKNYEFETQVYVRPDYQSEGYKCDESLRFMVKDPAYGVNFILNHGTGSKQIIITSHHDAVTGSPGANDNASSVAVCIALYQKLAREYANPNNNIKIIIFDDEEPTNSSGSAVYGSRIYVEKKGIENILCVYSLECCGAGDMVIVWPVISSTDDISGFGFKKKKAFDKFKNKESVGLKVFEDTVNNLGVYHETAGFLTSLYSDDLSFRLAGVNDAFCLAAVPRQDIEKLRGIAENPMKSYFLLGTGANKIPPLLRHYHTPEDRSEHLSEESMQMMLDVIYNTVVNLDKSLR